MRVLLVVLFLLAVARPSWAQLADDAVCQAAIAGAARKLALPGRVLGTIGLVESGRSIGRRVVPWPWSINVGGAGRTFATKQEAVAAVRDLLAAGVRSIDVGCMQVNLAAHPQAFETLETAFDPVSNADYAARFLQSLSQQTGQLAKAITAYHSQTPEFAADYARRILAVWPGAAAIGLTADLDHADTPSRGNTSRLAQDHPAGPWTRPPATGSQIQVVSTRGSAWPSTARAR